MSRLSPVLIAIALSTGCVEIQLMELDGEPTDTALADDGIDDDVEDDVTDDTDDGQTGDDDEDEDPGSDTGDEDITDTGTTTTTWPSDPEAVFDVAGEYSWTVPAGVTQVRIEAWGGGGHGGNQIGATGGAGGYASGVLTVTGGEVLDVQVAEGGVDRGDGGGASWIFHGTETLVVAAGGGGGGSDGCSGCKDGGAGGAGGGVVGETGQNLLTGFSGYCESATGGQGATQTAGGQGGVPTGNADYPCNGEDGIAGQGGMSAGVFGDCKVGDGAAGWRSGGGQGNGGGGGGGAGWYGGGGAGFIWTYCSGGGGGGSSYVAPTLTDADLKTGSGPVSPLPADAGFNAQGGDRLGAGADGLVWLTAL